jgi:polyphosphate glucokinase
VTDSSALSGHPVTLSIDIGGSGLKASALDPNGRMLVDRVRRETTYPMTPHQMVDQLAELVAPLPPYDRVSVGFPGMVRGGVLLTAPKFDTAGGPGTPVDPDLRKAWDHFDLATALQEKLGKPTRVVNDADMQGLAVVEGHGLEFVLTLGSGVGTALFLDGRLLPHLEMAHQPFRKGETYDEQLGDVTRHEIGNERWNMRVGKAIGNFAILFFYDHLYVGGGNAQRVKIDLGSNATIVDNTAGILGGIRLWDGPVV